MFREPRSVLPETIAETWWHWDKTIDGEKLGVKTVASLNAG